MKKTKKSQKLGAVALIAFMLAMVCAVVGLSSTVKTIDEIAISKSPSAILASAGLSEGENVYLSVAYFDQRADECVNVYDGSANEALAQRQFEWSKCDYPNKEMEQGLVEYELNEEYLPVATNSSSLIPNMGLSSFDRWFSSVEGKSESYTGALKLEYQKDNAEFSFYHDEFYPLDGAEFSNGDFVNEDGHNHLFSMSFAAPFMVLASGEESFDIEADDDTFVFVGNKLAIDMGGIHDVTAGHFWINENGEVYTGIGDQDLAYSGITLNKNDSSIVRIFHADRDSMNSVFNVVFRGMSLTITDAKLANRKGDGVQIAYDPTDPSYVAPLGETSVVKPDGTKGYIIMATIEGVMVIVFSVLMAAAIHSVVRRKLAAREAEREASQRMMTKKK